jgi:hypothetical protein
VSALVLACDLANDLACDLANDLACDLANDLACDLANDLAMLGATAALTGVISFGYILAFSLTLTGSCFSAFFSIHSHPQPLLLITKHYALLLRDCKKRMRIQHGKSFIILLADNASSVRGCVTNNEPRNK